MGVSSFFLLLTLISTKTAGKNDSFDRQYPKLAQWLDDKRFPQVVAAPIDFGISLGPNGSFWARRGDACRWHNVASSLDDWLQVAIGLGLQGIQVSLGVYGSYITYAPSQNGTQWVLNACYPTLEKILDDWLASPPGSAGDMGGRIIVSTESSPLITIFIVAIFNNQSLINTGDCYFPFVPQSKVCISECLRA